MSYSLQRIRLAEISRHLVDRTPFIEAHAGGPSLDVVMDINAELQMHFNDLPSFFSMSKADLSETYQLDSSQAAKIVHMGYMHRSLFYAQRCNLHLPNFSRGYVDSAYASSRGMCLQSARLIIQTETQLEKSGLCVEIRYKYLGLVTGIFLATTVVLMDLCHNKSSLQQGKRGREVADAFRILEQARHESETASRFLDSMMHVLRKHKVSPPKPNGVQMPNPGISTERPRTAAGGIALDTLTLSHPRNLKNRFWYQHLWLHQAFLEPMTPIASIQPAMSSRTGKTFHRISATSLRALNKG